MRVSLINANLVAGNAVGTCMINQAQFFLRRGDDVRVYILHPPRNAPPDVETVTSVVTLEELTEGTREHFRLSDLYIYHYLDHYTLVESIRGVDRGTVIFYYHSAGGRDALAQDVEGDALVHYADLCITLSCSDKQDLMGRVGYAADRIHVLPLPASSKQPTSDGEDPLEQYEMHLAQVVDQVVTYTLPEMPPKPDVVDSKDVRLTTTALQDELILNVITDEIKERSDIAIRGYVIRSGIPLVGSLIAWVRRNLTSHLREPYLDPMIERQVTFNYRVAEWMKRALSAWTAATRRQVELETRVKALEAQVEALTRHLNTDEPDERGA